MIVAPSMLAADFNHLLDDVKRVEEAEYLHVDVMDGHFVPNISFGSTVFGKLYDNVDMIFDVHLMIEHPLKYIDTFSDYSDIITFHYECCDDTLEVINKIKDCNKKVGISLKPNTKIELLTKYLDEVDMVLVMSVEPGFGGQKFLDSALDKIKYLDDYRKTNNLSYKIEVDGGINYENAKKCKENGCDIVVCGTYLFKSENPNKLIKELKEL